MVRTTVRRCEYRSSTSNDGHICNRTGYLIMVPLEGNADYQSSSGLCKLIRKVKRTLLKKQKKDKTTIELVRRLLRLTVQHLMLQLNFATYSNVVLPATAASRDERMEESARLMGELRLGETAAQSVSRTYSSGAETSLEGRKFQQLQRLMGDLHFNQPKTPESMRARGNTKINVFLISFYRSVAVTAASQDQRIEESARLMGELRLGETAAQSISSTYSSGARTSLEGGKFQELQHLMSDLHCNQPKTEESVQSKGQSPLETPTEKRTKSPNKVCPVDNLSNDSSVAANAVH